MLTAASLGAAVLALSGACSSRVEVRPSAEALVQHVNAIVELPTSIDWGGAADQQRIQRRTSDLLLDMTKGHVVIAEELRGQDDAYLSGMLRKLGEDSAHAISLTISVGLGRRLVNGAAPIPGFQISKRLVTDFYAHVDVRRVGSQELIGVVETIATGPVNEPEVGPRGERRAAMEAIYDAVGKALRTFAPGLYSPDGEKLRTHLVEVPVEVAHSLQGRLAKLAELYPELSVEQIQLLGASRERLLVLDPGDLGGFGIQTGDLLGVPAGADARATRAALIRALARHQHPLLAVTRQGQHYVLAND